MNNQAALAFEHFSISWFAIFVTVGCLAGFLAAGILRRADKQPASDVLAVAAFGVPLGLIFARMQYCAFMSDRFSNFWQVLNVTNGGFGLYGAMVGVCLAIVIMKYVCRTEDIKGLFDCMAAGSALAISIGRFAMHYTDAENGDPVSFEWLTVYDAEQKLHLLAVYALDGFFEAVIFVVCIWFFIYARRHGKKDLYKGKTALVMLALHGTNQVLVESLRSDALKLGLNEFIKVSQIIGIVCCVAVLVWFMVKVIRASRFQRRDTINVIIILACIVLGILSEYRVGNGNYISKHLLMLASMIILGALTVRYGMQAVKGGRAASPVRTPVSDVDYAALAQEMPSSFGRVKAPEPEKPAENRLVFNEEESIFNVKEPDFMEDFSARSK